MLEGGERTPMLNPVELEEIGSMLVSYPLYLIGISISTLEVHSFSFKNSQFLYSFCNLEIDLLMVSNIF